MNDIESCWFALVIGNSRHHWALFKGEQIQQIWHLSASDWTTQSKQPQTWSEWQSFFPSKSIKSLAEDFGPFPELWIVSVVPTQTELWQAYPQKKLLKLNDIPLQQVYPSLGLDRAVCLWGAGSIYGWPCLVIDGGTALTVTGADSKACFIGGSILPGLAIQRRSLAQSTSALPTVDFPEKLPELWGKDTSTSIQSGILNITIAGLSHIIEQWIEQYPDSQIVITGGDAKPLSNYLREWISQTQRLQSPLILSHIQTDLNLGFLGINAIRQRALPQP